MSDTVFNLKTPFYFENELNRLLANNLPQNLRRQISRLLALDYAGRLQSKPEILSYSGACVNNIANYLKQQVIFEEDFGTAFSLFTIAISGDKNQRDQQEQEKQLIAAIDNILQQSGLDISPAMAERLRGLLLNRLRVSKNLNTDLELLAENAKKVLLNLLDLILNKNIPAKALEPKINQIFNQIINAAKQQKHSSNLTSDLVSKVVITALASTFVAGAILLGGSFIIPALIPAFGGAIQYSSRYSIKHSNSKNISGFSGGASGGGILLDEPEKKLLKNQAKIKTPTKSLKEQIGAIKINSANKAKKNEKSIPTKTKSAKKSKSNASRSRK